MDASCTKKRPLDTSVINDQILDLFAGQSPATIILEKDYLELKSEVGYWKAMHAKAVKREQSLKDKIKVLEGQNRDLKKRVFSKQNEKTGTKKGEGNQHPRIPKDLVVSNPAAKGTALQNDQIWLKHKKLSSSRKNRYALNAENHTSRMALASRRQLRLKSKPINVSSTGHV